jgi:proteasome lid subunit RPN8/RPN11
VKIFLTVEHLEIIRTEAERVYPHECCGVLLGFLTEDRKFIVEEVRPTENVWNGSAIAEFERLAPGARMGESKRGNYAIAPQDLLRVQKQARDRNLNIIGIYHSHPDCPAIPSEFDRQVAWQEYSYIIISVTGGKAGEVKSWRLDDDHQFQQEEI